MSWTLGAVSTGPGGELMTWGGSVMATTPPPAPLPVLEVDVDVDVDPELDVAVDPELDVAVAPELDVAVAPEPDVAVDPELDVAAGDPELEVGDPEPPPPEVAPVVSDWLFPPQAAKIAVAKRAVETRKALFTSMIGVLQWKSKRRA